MSQGAGRGAPFTNLGFDEVNTSALNQGGGLAKDLLPGWQISAPGLPLGQMQYNDLAQGAAGILALYDPGIDPALARPLEGKFAIAARGPRLDQPALLISQVATVPADAKFLRFDHA